MLRHAFGTLAGRNIHVGFLVGACFLQKSCQLITVDACRHKAKLRACNKGKATKASFVSQGG